MVFRVVLLIFSIAYSAFAVCPDGAVEGFTEDGTDACYLYERFPAQWVTAEKLCRDSQGHLASISNLFVNDFVAQAGVEAFEIMGVDDFWIGWNDLESKGHWEWVDGAKFNFTNWDADQPADTRSDCTALSLPEGLWVAESCYAAKPYVCELKPINTTVNPKTRGPQTTSQHHPKTTATRGKRTRPTQPTLDCQNGWAYLNSTRLCYKITKDVADCYHPSTQEASIHSKAENEFIGKLAAKQSKGNVKVRLGAAQYTPKGDQLKLWTLPRSWAKIKSTVHRRKLMELLRRERMHKKQEWTWFDGSAFDFANWANGQPKGFDAFTCVQLNTKHKFMWSTNDCIDQADYSVCSQKPA